MSYLLYILFFLAGATGVFIFYKVQLKKWSNRLNTEIDELKSSDSNPNQTINKYTGENLPPELSLVIEKFVSELKQKKVTEEKSETKTVQPDPPDNFKKTIDNLYIVNELGQKLTSSLYLYETFKHLYTTINSMMDAAVIELNVYSETSGSYKTISNLQNTDGNKEVAVINHLSEWCYKNNREVFLTDAENDFGRYVFQPLVLQGGRMAKSVIAFPIINRKIVSGTLCIISFQKGSFEEYHREIIRLLLGYIAVALDNALRHEELNLTKIRAEQGEKFKEQFLANMSHEIRTPINAVTGITRLLLEKQPRQDQLRYLESIKNASDSLLVIINDILDLSKIEAGKIELEKIDFSVFDLIRNVKEIMNFKAEEKGLIFNDIVDESIPPVLKGDPTRLTQILINLVGNAIKFTTKGSVKMVVSPERGKKFPKSEKSIDDYVSIKFKVMDTGIGMTDEQTRKLFQNYSQAGSDTARKYGGTGLGLSICKQLVQLHGGTIEVESKPGAGSTFTFSLSFPVSKSKVIPSEEKVVSADMLYALRGLKILLADDNEYNRIVAKETIQLKVADVLIDEAVDGLSALELIRKNKYDLVLMDLVMPGVDGLEATRTIRNEFPSPLNSIKIVALTASVTGREIEKCMAAGMNGFIPKPFKSDELFGAIYKAISDIPHLTKLPEIRNDRLFAESYFQQNTLIDFSEGDEVRMQRYIDQFLTKTLSGMDNLVAALENKDFDEARVVVHNIKPLLRVMGVNLGSELADEIEQGCIARADVNELRAKANQLFEICKQTVEQVRAFDTKKETKSA